MRTSIVPVLLLAIASHAAPVPPEPSPALVDLDKSGALEQLKRDHPTHYERVVAEMEKIQALPLPSNPSQLLRFDPSAPESAQRQILTSDPAKTRATLTVDSVVYSFTVHYTKDPAKAVPTK